MISYESQPCQPDHWDIAKMLTWGGTVVTLIGFLTSKHSKVRATLGTVATALGAAGAYSGEFVQRFRGYSSTDSNLKSSTRSNGFRPRLGASATARLLLLGLI